MNKKRTWILIADGARARVVTRASGDRYEDIGGFDLIADNRATQAHNADRPGRTFDSAGAGRHAMEPPSDAKEEEQRRLAHRVMDMLHREYADKHFEQLIVVAAPKMLGNLRDAIMPDLKQAVIEEIDKDITRLSGKELDGQLAKLITRVH